MNTTVKKESITSATGTNAGPIIPLTMEGVKARLVSFNGNATAISVQARNRLRVDSAHRTARLDVQEAKVKHEIKKLDYGAEPFPDALQRKQELNADLEAIKAWRKINEIFDAIEQANKLRKENTGDAEAANQQMAEVKAEAAALEIKISDIRARDVRPELEKASFLEDELRWVRQIMNDGKWKRTSVDYRETELALELDLLAVQAKYHGEKTFAGVEARITEIEQQLEHLEKLAELSLTPAELSHLNELECQLFEINSRISQQTSIFEELCQRARDAEEMFNEFFEVSEIAALSVVEVYQITSEVLTTRLPG